MKILAECYITLLRKRQRRPGLGERTGEAQNPGAPQSQRCPPARALSRGCTDRPRHPQAHSKRTQAPPFAAGGLSSPRSKARRCRCTAQRGKVSADAGRGTRDAGRGGLTFPTGTKAATASTRGGSDSAPRDRRDYASQNPDGSRTQPAAPVAEVIPLVFPDYTYQNSEATSSPS